jgi:hypothetical protein
MDTLRFVLLIVGVLVAVALIAGLVGRFFVRRGLRTPFVVRLINRTSGQMIDMIKEPITIAVLDEVADVLRSGHYTRNVASALRENGPQLKGMVAEKIKQDPTTRRIGLLPFHDKLIAEASETVLRVVLSILADPRTDELVSDILRDNIDQLRGAVRQRQTER